MKKLLSGWLLRCLLHIALIGTLSFAGSTACAEQFDGFVTKAATQSDFYLSSLHVSVDANTQCATATLHEEISWVDSTAKLFSSVPLLIMYEHLDAKTTKTAPCATLQWAIGSRVRIIGDLLGPDSSFRATQITLLNTKWSLSNVPDSMLLEGEGAALLEETPQVVHSDNGWAGTMWVNGYPFSITPGTELLTAPQGTRLTYRPPGDLVDLRIAISPLVPTLKASRWFADSPKETAPPFTESLFQPNNWAVFQGDEAVSGQIALKSLQLWPFQLDEKEKKYLAELSPLVISSDTPDHTPSTVGFIGPDESKSVRILTDRAVQDYVSAIGASLIPAYQKALPEEAKVHFHFYVTQGQRPSPDDEMETLPGVHAWSQSALNAGAVAFPDGTILLPDYLLARLGNEAQLATILSDAIASVVQKQGFIERNAKIVLGGLKEMDFYHHEALVYPVMRNEQALRIGIRQMYLAGYDIREAPGAWSAAAGKPTNPYNRTKKHHDAIPWYTAYSFDYLRTFYSDLDLSRLKRGEKEYAQFLDQLRKSAPEAFTRKK